MKSIRKALDPKRPSNEQIRRAHTENEIANLPVPAYFPPVILDAVTTTTL
jgi:hypothetical protein